MRTALVVCLLCLVASCCAADDPLIRLDSVSVYGAGASLQGGLQAGPTFLVNGVYSLQVKVVWRRIPDGVHVLNLRYTTPDGTLYETTSTPFTTHARPTASSMTTKIDGVVHPVAVQAARTVPGTGSEVWGELLTAGTWAQRLPGNWKLDVLLDKSESTLGSTGFTLQAGPGT